MTLLDLYNSCDNLNARGILETCTDIGSLNLLDWDEGVKYVCIARHLGLWNFKVERFSVKGPNHVEVIFKDDFAVNIINKYIREKGVLKK